MLPVSRTMAVPASSAWDLLVDTHKWSQWGPSVRAVELAGGRLGIGSHGRVQTPFGVWLPFQVTQFEEGRSWAWKVAGVPATTHKVEDHRIGCKVTFGVPLLAGPYVLLCGAALKRIEQLAMARSTR